MPHCTIKTSEGDPLQRYPVQKREFIISSKETTENIQCLTGRDLFVTGKYVTNIYLYLYLYIFKSWVKKIFADI